MRFATWVLLVLAWLLAAAATTWAQSGSPSATPPATSHQPHDQPGKSLEKTQRPPTHRTAVTKARKTPVVQPHGPTHPHKAAPSLAGRPAAVQPAAPAPVPAQPAPDTATAQPQQQPSSEKPEGAAAALPRFASLRSDDVNMRAGPGMRYRIDWVYKRRDLPVEIEREFDIWRWVRDADGIEGWVHQATLMGRRSFIVQKTEATLRAHPNDTAPAVAILQPGVIGRVRSCEAASDWCNVQTGSYRGFLRRQQFWGVFPGEAVNP